MRRTPVRIACLLIAILVVPAASAAGRSDNEAARLQAPLLRYKLELAKAGGTYVHVLPEAIVVYTRGIELKRLPVEKHWRLQQRLLERGRVADWTPQVRGPMLLAGENRPVDAERFLQTLVTLDKMPATFSVLLADDTLIQVTASDSGSFQPQRRVVAVSPEAETPPPDVIHLEMAPEAARQFYWLLVEGLPLIY